MHDKSKSPFELGLGRQTLALVAATMLVGLVACTSPYYSAPSPTPTPAPAAPSIKITSPANDSTVAGSEVRVFVEVASLNLVDKKGQTNVAGEGHIHYFMDVNAPTAPGVPAFTAAGTFAASSSASYAWPNVAPDAHTFSVELVNNDHTPLIPPVVATVRVTVTGGINSVPAPASAPGGQAVTVNISAQNMAFDRSTISVPAGANVTMVFNNRDTIPHNVAVYRTQAASEVIYRGEVFSGPRTVTYQFMAPTTPGTYFFRCDVHPTAMTGSFIVTGTGSSGGGY